MGGQNKHLRYLHRVKLQPQNTSVGGQTQAELFLCHYAPNLINCKLLHRSFTAISLVDKATV